MVSSGKRGVGSRNRASGWRGLARDRRAVTMLEFAIVGPPALLMLVFLTEIAYDFYAQEALNYAVASSARCVQVGFAQKITDGATFKTAFLCPAIGALLPCSNVTVNIQTIATDYLSDGATSIPLRNKRLDTSGFGVNPGLPGQLMLVQAVYTSPSIVAGFLPGLAVANGGGGLVRATIASAAFVNENFPAIATTPPPPC